MPAFDDGQQVDDSTLVYDVGSLAQTPDRDVFVFLARAPAPRPRFPCILYGDCSPTLEKKYWEEMARPESNARFVIEYDYVNCHSLFMKGGKQWFVDSAGHILATKTRVKQWIHLPSLAKPICRKILDPP